MCIRDSIYALEGTEVLVQRNKEVQMTAHDFGKGRAVYIPVVLVVVEGEAVYFLHAQHAEMCIRDRCTTISPALPYALFDTDVSGASEKDQYNGKIVFDGVIESAKTCLLYTSRGSWA